MDKIIRQLFEFRKGPTPWSKALFAGISTGLPIFIGALTGNLDLGLLGGIGGFTYIYVFNETYSTRFKKIFLVALSIAFLVGLGTITAPYPWLMVLILGLIGFLATFIFGVYRISGPAALIFVLSFSITASLPVNPSEAPLRFILVLASGLFAWMLSMIGWFIDPHKAEKKAVEDVYSSLGNYCAAIGSPSMNDRRNNVIEALRSSEETLSSGFLSKNSKMEYNRLVMLNNHADDLLLELIEIGFKRTEAIPSEITNMIIELNSNIKILGGKIEKVSFSAFYENLEDEYIRLTESISRIRQLIEMPLENIESEVSRSLRPSRRMNFVRALDRDFIVFTSSVRHGIVLSISAIVAFSFPFVRPDWIPLSCAAVMFGPTIMATFSRAVLRCAGTIAGTYIAAAILAFHPAGAVIALISMILTALTEIFVVRNYALVAMFLTPNALLLADAVANSGNYSHFMTGRIVTVSVGSIIGLAGTYIIGRKSASSRLAGLTAKLIRRQARAIVRLEANKENGNIHDTQWIREKMEIDLANLKLAYNTALGEIPANHENLEIMWPVISSLEHITYLIVKNFEGKKYMVLSAMDLAKILLVFEKTATAIEQRHMFKNMMLLDIEAIPKICSEINHLQEIISMKNIYE